MTPYDEVYKRQLFMQQGNIGDSKEKNFEKETETDKQELPFHLSLLEESSTISSTSLATWCSTTSGNIYLSCSYFSRA